MMCSFKHVRRWIVFQVPASCKARCLPQAPERHVASGFRGLERLQVPVTCPSESLRSSTSLTVKDPAPPVCQALMLRLESKALNKPNPLGQETGTCQFESPRVRLGVESLVSSELAKCKYVLGRRVVNKELWGSPAILSGL